MEWMLGQKCQNLIFLENNIKMYTICGTNFVIHTLLLITIPIFIKKIPFHMVHFTFFIKCNLWEYHFGFKNIPHVRISANKIWICVIFLEMFPPQDQNWQDSPSFYTRVAWKHFNFAAIKALCFQALVTAGWLIPMNGNLGN